MVALNLDHYALAVGGRHPERIAGSLHDQSRDRDRVQFGKSARRRSCSLGPPRLQRECETHDCDCFGHGGGAAGNPRAQGTATNQQRQVAQLPLPQSIDHGDPGGVELARGRRRASAGDPIGLLHQADADTLGQRSLTGRQKVRRRHPSSRAMTKQQPSTCPVGTIQMNARRP